MEMKFYSPLTAEFFPDEPDWEDESYNEYEGYPMDGHDLLQYADAVDEAVKKDIADFNGDLMQYYHEDDSVRQKVVSAVPSVEIHGNKLCGCLNVELRESLNEGEQAVLCDYISGQYSDGWGEGFEQRDIRVEEGTLAVHFWQEDGFKMTPTFEKTQEQVQMTQRPKMKLLGEDGNIFAIMGRASLLLKNAGQSDKAKEKPTASSISCNWLLWTPARQMLRNPVYVQADLDVYEFFKSQGTVIVNDVADFTGMNGCYLYQGRDVKASKKNDLKDQMLVLAPHEGIVPSDTWLTCRKKLMNNMKIQSARKATHTWLAGKIKCGNCGYALMSIYNPSGKQYLRCTKRLDNKSCPGCGKIITSELEAVVYQQMVKKLASYKTLTGKKKAAKANPKITALQVELAHVDSEIEKLVDSLTGANNVLFSYVNVKIAELDGRKQELLARIAELTVEAISPEQVSQISGYLDTWENVSFDDKRRVVDLMITTIAATSDSLNITWKI